MVFAFGLWESGKQGVKLQCHVLKWRLSPSFISAGFCSLSLVSKVLPFLSCLEHLMKLKHITLLSTLQKRSLWSSAVSLAGSLCLSSPQSGPGRRGFPLRASRGQGYSQASRPKVAVTGVRGAG